jgi:glycosyltransferase involved in cell wall biosynthesis
VKVIQIPFCFYPDPVGGTEVYVEALSRHLQEQGVNVLVAAPGSENQSYFHQKLPVRRFAISSRVADLREMYGEGDKLAATEFSKILDEEQPDVLHLHAFTWGASLRLVRAAKQRQIPVVFTYHTPAVSCQRGTLMQGGTKICDGKLELHTCVKCSLQGLGLNRIGADVIGSLPPLVGRCLGDLKLSGGAWTALRMTELLEYRLKSIQALMSEVDRIVAVCTWVQDVLVCNHVPPEKITIIRQGLCQDSVEKPSLTQASDRADSSLRIAFLGRLDPIKGVDVLIKALRTDPLLPVSLDIYGISQGTAGDAYQQHLLALSEKDPRISFKFPVPAEKVVEILAEYDLLAVPSQCLETGPLVVLEAFAAGIPVIGSNLGGIAELVKHEVNGLLVEPNSVKAWCQQLQRLCQDTDLRMQLGAGISPPQRMKAVTEEMEKLYQVILQENAAAQHGAKSLPT